MGKRDARRTFDTDNNAACRAKTGTAREAILRKWHELMAASIDDLATILTSEQGKLLIEASGELQYAASVLEWLGEAAKRSDRQFIPTISSDRHFVVARNPI